MPICQRDHRGLCLICLYIQIDILKINLQINRKETSSYQFNYLACFCQIVKAIRLSFKTLKSLLFFIGELKSVVVRLCGLSVWMHRDIDVNLLTLVLFRNVSPASQSLSCPHCWSTTRCCWLCGISRYFISFPSSTFLSL